MQVVGQTNNLEIINKWERLPNFIIIQGDVNTGKTYLTEYICEKFKVSYVRVGNSIKEVRQLLDTMSVNANVLYHFKDFDRASKQAQNALLKITEETPNGNTIVITGSRQIPTLESRARKLVMSAYTKEEMLTYLSKYYTKDKTFEYYKAGFNTPTKAIIYNEYENIDNVLNFAYTVFDYLSILGIDMVIYISQRFENRYDKLDVAILFIEMLINIINYKSKNELDYKYSFKNVLNILIYYKNLLSRDKTLNRRFVLYRMLYNIMQLKGEL